MDTSAANIRGDESPGEVGIGEFLPEAVMQGLNGQLTVLIDADGRVVEKIYGAREWDGPYALNLVSQAFGERQETSRE